jgi:hypothetical protein
MAFRLSIDSVMQSGIDIPLIDSNMDEEYRGVQPQSAFLYRGLSGVNTAKGGLKRRTEIIHNY